MYRSHGAHTETLISIAMSQSNVYLYKQMLKGNTVRQIGNAKLERNNRYSRIYRLYLEVCCFVGAISCIHAMVLYLVFKFIISNERNDQIIGHKLYKMRVT